MTPSGIHRTIEAVWRIESARLVGSLARLTRDVGVAEELAQDALVAALEQWPQTGLPDNPAAWLMATARHLAIDRLRRNTLLVDKHRELEYELRLADSNIEPQARSDDEFGDEFLRAATLTSNLRERRLLDERAARCATTGGAPPTRPRDNGLMQDIADALQMNEMTRARSD